MDFTRITILLRWLKTYHKTSYYKPVKEYDSVSKKIEMLKHHKFQSNPQSLMYNIGYN